ncbi:FHA domain-containing protein [Citrus sinensis]|uniref:FHA domain-containing protein n=1 Tax=Citrus sinensis TaxID=2711 RepID=A0ACB8J2L0_CITSI|nr:FHA domain-containing protein [Citrus sinensis]
MAALAASVSSWIPEDDILLKNAVEAGASLEALAKGAVRFSRKFTIQELRDRWHSLLYDPVISAEASARMVEFELSASSKSIRSGIGMDAAEFTPKRKVETVRRLYHALRKKICIQPSNSPNINILGSPNRNGSICDGVACQGNHETRVVSSMLGDCVQNRFEFQEMDIDLLPCATQDNNFAQESVAHDVFEQKIKHENPAHIMGEALVDFENCPSFEGMGPSNTLPESDASFHSLGCSSPQTRTPLWKTIEDMPAPAMPINLSHEVKDAKDTIDKPCSNRNNPILLSSPKSNAHQEDVPDTQLPGTCLAIPDGSSHAELEVMVVQSPSGKGNQHDVCSSDVKVPSSSLFRNFQSHDHPEREMECILNSEDLEIPCNDDFIPGKVITSSAVQALHKEVSDLAPSFTTWKKNEKKLSLRKEDNSSPSFTAPQMGGSDLFTGSSHNQLFSGGVKSKSLDVISPAGVPKNAENDHADPSQCRSRLATPKSIAQAAVEQDSLSAFNVTDLQLHASSSTNPSTLGQEASLDHEESESDDDIPYFSDIESLILDMDLCPDDWDQCFSKEVSRYQHEDTKRTIIRLEQCAQSAMQRAISYQGALAIFYGRCLKHYIKTTEIILGRATDGIDVDIDLGREGRANKISRRQALIKMEQDGSFFLKNLGKSSMFLNGKEIATGQAGSLSSSSLIEIREMAFVFEINHKSVREYVANATKRNQEKNTNFEWSERVP